MHSPYECYKCGRELVEDVAVTPVYIVARAVYKVTVREDIVFYMHAVEC